MMGEDLPQSGTRRLRWRWIGLGILLVVLACAGLFIGAFPRLLAWELQHRPDGRLPPVLSAQAQALHSKLLVVDLNAATLMWSRDLLSRGAVGQVDLPRLTDGNVALEVFGVATRLDRAGSLGGLDLMTPLAIAQLWPPRTWNDTRERALYQADRLRGLLRGAGSRIIGIRTKADMDRLLLARTQARENGLAAPVGAMLALRGGSALAGGPENLAAMFEAGFRMAVPPVVPLLSRTASAGRGVAPASRGVLAEAARAWVESMEGLGMVVDVAGMSGDTLEAVLASARQPLMASHTGLRGACDRPGNLSDAEARGVAATGGLVGIAFTPEALCGTTLNDIVKSVRYAVDLVGVDHVALGSNFDAGARTPIDAAGLAHLTQSLTAGGFSDDDIVRITGANAWRLLRSVLPP
jgi:microsomal dipeptidase-like Zn-dependent dipeptidase